MSGTPKILGLKEVPEIQWNDWVELHGEVEFEDAAGNVWVTGFHRPHSGTRQLPQLKHNGNGFREVYDPFEDATVAVLDSLGIRLGIGELKAIVGHLDAELARMERNAQKAAEEAWGKGWADQLP